MLPSSHAVPFGSGVPAAHTPAWQVSWPLHGSWSPHLVPFALGTCLHPTSLSHESVVHSLWSSQSGAVPPRQIPAAQVSAPLQGLPSLHDVPSGGRVPLVHTPLWQVSSPLQAKPSLHGLP